jgi:hypothetical protein
LARNWIKLLAGVFLFFLLLGFGIFASVMAMIRSSDAATESVLRAQSNPLVVQLLGSPIKEGWLVGGSINVTTDSGDAELSVPISGPKGEGTVYVTGHKSAGTWSYSQMLAAIKGSSQKIDLLSSETAGTTSGANTTGPAQPAQAAPQSQSEAAPASQPSDTPVTTTAMAASAPASSAPAAGSDVIQSQDTNTSGVVGELTQCKRSEGVLSVRVRFRNSSSKAVQFTVLEGNSNYEKIYVTAASKKYFILKDSQNTYLTPVADYACGGPGVCARLAPGDVFNWWAKFPAPSAEVKKINLMIPVGPPFEDVPITDK